MITATFHWFPVVLFCMVVNMVRVMVFNATFNNISLILWQSVLLVEETRVPGENYWPAISHRQTLSHKVVLSTPHQAHWERGSAGVAPRGPQAKRGRKKTRVYLAKGKQNKMCAFVNMWMTILCSGYQIFHAEVAPCFRKEPINDFHRALGDV